MEHTTSIKWRSRLIEFKKSYYTSMYIDDNTRTELLFDILQDLFSEHLKEDLRIELVLFIEEYVEVLIPNIDRAEQAFGSLQNVFDFLGNHLVALKCQVLTTMTILVIVFDFKEVKLNLYQELLNHFLDTIFKVNIGHPLLRKTCSQCLIMFSEHFKDGLCEHVSTLLATAKAERSFASYDHILLLAYLTYYISESLKSAEEQTETGTNVQSEINKCISFLIDQNRALSSTSLLQMMRKLLPCLKKGRISRSLLNNLLRYSFQSWDILLTYFSVFVQTKYSYLLQSQYDEERIMTVLMKLLLAKGLDQVPKEYAALTHQWMDGVFVNLPENVYQNASYMAYSTLQPTIYDQMATFPSTFQSIVSVAKYSKTEIPGDIQSAMMEMVLKCSNSIRSHKETSSFFISLFHLYCNSSKKIKDRVISLIEEMAVKNLHSSLNVIDFCESIEKQYQKGSSTELLKRITQRLLRFPMKEILPLLKDYLNIFQHVAGIKDIWPMAVIDKLDELVKSTVLDDCSWNDGSLLLSVCKEILICHGSVVNIRYGVASILYTISQKFDDYNICDRAIFYYLIIGNVSHKYFSNLLVSYTNKKNLWSNQIGEVTKVINSGLPFIKQVKKTFLSFQMTKEDEYEERYIEKYPECSLIEDYHRFLETDYTDKSLIKLFELKHLNCEENDDDFNEIFGINIEFTTYGPYKAISNIICPHLSTHNTQSEPKGLFKVRFHPSKPCSAKFNTSVTFIDIENQCWTMKLPSFVLTFANLIQPLPRISEVSYVEELFDEVWKDIEGDQRTISNSSSNKALSVKSLAKIEKESLISSLSPFVVVDDQDFVKVAFYLPPSSTILLKFEFSELRTLARIATDDYTLLDDLDHFLSNIRRY